MPDAVREAEGLVDVQFRLEPRYPAFYQRASVSSDVVAVRRLLGRAEVDPEFWQDLEQVADDLTSWRRFISFGAPLPVPLPDADGPVIAASEEERSALIPEFFGDIATLAYGESFGRISLSAVDITTLIHPVPNAEVRVRLGSARDALGVLRAELNWQLSRADRESVVRAIELLGVELGRAGLGRLQTVLDPEGESWPDDLAGGWHHMGTTRMHDDPRHGVVDRDCRVHGVRNLYVAGSSVFTTAGSATPTLTIVALALRLVVHLEATAR